MKLSFENSSKTSSLRRAVLFFAAFIIAFQPATFGRALAATEASEYFSVSLITSGADTLPPTVPSNMAATAVSSSQIDLSWDASSDLPDGDVPPSGVAGYRIFRDSAFLSTTTLTSYSDTGLTASTAYEYFVQAFDNSLNISASSDPATATTSATPVIPVPPSVPGQGSTGSQRLQILSFGIQPGETRADVSFTTNLPSQAKVYWGKTNGYEAGTLSSLFYGTTHELALTGLEVGTDYMVRIEAIDGRGSSVFQDASFKTLSPLGEVPLANPSDFRARAAEKQISLTWINTEDPRLDKVRIVRGADFFPKDPFDGQPIYEGKGEQAYDADVEAGKTYYYAIFSVGKDGTYSSGALAQAKLALPGEAPLALDPFADIPESDNADPKIKALTLADFDFIQDGHLLAQVNGQTVAIDGTRDLTIKLAYDKVPEVLKTVAFTLSDPHDPTKVFPFLLRINSDKTAYEATIGALGRSGNYLLSVVVLDYQNQGLKRIQGNLRAAAFEAFGDDRNFDPLAFIFLFILFMAALFISALRKSRKRIGYGQAFGNASRSSISAILIFISASLIAAGIPATRAEAAFNPEINYQGKLTTTANVAVPNGSYSIRFNLYTAASGGSPVWTETWCYSPDNGATCDGSGTDNRVALTNGLFSAMLGSTTALSGVDFNQTLYLGVQIGGSGATPRWDSEMTPRKRLGAVPAAFVAEFAQTASSSDALSGLSASQFLRSDAENATSSATTFLNIVQNGAGKVAEFFGPVGQSILSILSNGNVGIGTTSPWRNLSVEGTSDLGWNAMAGSFTATSSTASIFPYASTTALTVSGTNGLSLGSLNGFLQAINGAVSASSTLSIAYGGTGLPTAPTYGQLLLGNASGGYDLTSTSSLGLLSVSQIGSGTRGQIAFFNADGTTISATSSLFIAENENVGIGTTSPISEFAIEGNVPEITLKNTYLTTQTWQLRNGSISPGTTKFDIFDYSKNKSRLAIDSEGQLLIGTTTNSVLGNNSKVFVWGGDNGAANIDAMGNSEVAFGDAAVFEAEGADYGLDGNQNSIAIRYYGDNSLGVPILGMSDRLAVLDFGTSDNAIIRTVEDTPILFGVNNTEQVRLTSTGFGIGTTTPFTKLSVAGNAYIGGDLTATGTLSLAGAFQDSTNSAGADGYVLKSTGSATQWVATSTLGFASASQIGSGTQGQIAFYNANGTAISATSSLFIAQSGNVGISTTSPFARLSVAGDSYFGGNVSATGTVTTYGSSLTDSAQISSTELADSAGWTSTNWTGDFDAGFTHSAGNTSPLSRSMTVSGTAYQISFTISGRTAGSIRVSLGYATTTQTFYSNEAHVTAPKAAVDNGPLIFTPTSDFDGTISSISVKKILNISSPIFVLKDSTGAVGTEIRQSLSTLANTFLGYRSGGSVTVGKGNSALGSNALYGNTTGDYNSAFGNSALYTNSIGLNNSAIGAFALYTNTTGSDNSALGYNSLRANTTGTGNSALGVYSLYSNSSGQYNSALGYASLQNNSTGSYNTAYGASALGSNISGSNNVALGSNALFKNTIGSGNLAIGYNALYNNTTGTGNAVGGYEALGYNASATSSTAFGYQAGRGASNTSNQNNSLFGYQSGYALSTGSNNLLLGYKAGDALNTGSNNILLGYDVDATSTDSVNFLNIGNTIYGNLGTDFVGIGTTTPWRSLSVYGSSDLGTNALAGSFTATSSTASVFPYASTTALTVSGANGLTLGSLNGPLQAVNGAVSATSTLSIAYGGTGLSTAPSYGQLLVGDASGGYTLTSTSSLGISAGSATGQVIVAHADGTETAYSTVTDTDVARGNLLLDAVSWTDPNDVIKLSADVFDIGASDIDLATSTGSFSIQGSGKYLTTIKSSSINSGNGIIIKAAASSSVSHLTIEQTNGSGDGPVWGTVAAGDIDNARLSDVRVIGLSHGVYVSNSGSFTGELDDVTIESKSDGLYMGAAGTLTINDSSIASATSTGSFTRAIVAAAGTLNIYDTDMSASGGSSYNYGVYAAGSPDSAVVNLDGGSIKTSGTEDYDIYNEELTPEDISVTANTAYDHTKTYGTVTFSDSNRIVKSIGTATLNFGIGTTSPFAKLSVAGDSYIGGNLTATGTLSVLGTATSTIAGGFTVGTTNLLVQGATGRVGLGTASPTAVLHLKAGTSAANTAPLKFTSGTLLGTAEVGAVEFDGSKYYGTITGPSRKEFTLNDAALSSGYVPYATTNGRLTGSTNMTWNSTDKALVLAGQTTNSSLRVGALEFQGYGINNNWFGDNIYYNNALGGFIRRNTGSAGMFYFQGTEGQFRFFNSGSSGTVAGNSGNYVQLKIMSNGTVALGNSFSTASNDVSNAMLVASPSGVSMGQLSISTTTATSTINTGGFAVDTDKFVIQQNSGNIGIGTTSPSARFTISGGTTITTIASPTGAVATLDGGMGTYDDCNAFTYQYRIYSYKTVGSSRVYSPSYSETDPVTDDGMCDESNLGISVSWDDVLGASGFRVLAYNESYGYAYDYYYDTTDTSFVDDNSLVFAAGNTVTPTSLASSNGKDIYFDDTNLLLRGPNLGIGTSTPSAALDVYGYSGTNDIFAISSSTNSRLITVNAAGNLGLGISNPTYTLQVNGTPAALNTTVFTNYSDARLKENIEQLGTGYLDKILSLKPVSFNYNELTGFDEDARNKKANGFVAQDLSAVFPDMVGTTTINGTEYFDTNLSSLPIYMVRAIQEQQGQINKLATSTGDLASTTLAIGSKNDAISVSISEVKGSIAELASRVESISSTTPQASVSIESIASSLDSLDKKFAGAEERITTLENAVVDLSTSTASALASSDSFLQKIASSSVSMIASTKDLVQIIAGAVTEAIKSAGELALNKISAHVAYVTRVEAETAAISKGLEMTDQNTGQIYCISIANGDWSKRLGTCSSVSSTPVITSWTDGAVSSKIQTVLTQAPYVIATSSSTSSDSLSLNPVSTSTQAAATTSVTVEQPEAAQNQTASVQVSEPAQANEEAPSVAPANAAEQASPTETGSTAEAAPAQAESAAQSASSEAASATEPSSSPAASASAEQASAPASAPSAPSVSDSGTSN